MDTTIGLPPEAKKIAHFVEHERTIEVNRKEKHKVSEEKVDNEVVNFIKRTDEKTLSSSINSLIALDYRLSLQFYLLLFYMQELYM